MLFVPYINKTHFFIPWAPPTLLVVIDNAGAYTRHMHLSHWGRDKIAISRTKFSNAFSWMKYMNFVYDFAEVCWLGSNNNIPALVQIIAWRCPGDMPLSEPMIVTLLTHICVTRPQWVKCIIFLLFKLWLYYNHWLLFYVSLYNVPNDFELFYTTTGDTKQFENK